MESQEGRRSPPGICAPAYDKVATPARKSTNEISCKPSKRRRGFAFMEILSSDSSSDLDLASNPKTAKVSDNSMKNNLFSTKTATLTEVDRVKEHRNNQGTTKEKTPTEEQTCVRRKSFVEFKPSASICGSSNNNSDTGWLSRCQIKPKAPKHPSGKQIDAIFKKYKESESQAGWLVQPDDGNNQDSDSCGDDVSTKCNSSNQINTPPKIGRFRVHDRSKKSPNSGSDSESSTNQATANFDPKKWRGRTF